MDNGISAEFDRVAEAPQEGITRFQDMSAHSGKIHREKFMTALREGDLKTVRAYVDTYSDALTYVFSYTGYKDTAFQIAAKSGQTLVVAYLAGKGADINWRGPDGKGDTPAEAAAIFNQEKVVLELLDLGAKPSTALLMLSASKALPAAVERLLDMGLSPNAEDPDGTSVLMNAALGSTARGAERDQTVDLLLKRGADPLHEDRFFQTAVSTALLSVNVSLAAKLDRAQREAKMKAHDASLKKVQWSAGSIKAPKPVF